MKLKAFVEACGGKEEAAVQLGVRATTIWRWLKKISVPKGNNARRLREMGVSV